MCYTLGPVGESINVAGLTDLDIGCAHQPLKNGNLNVNWIFLVLSLLVTVVSAVISYALWMENEPTQHVFAVFAGIGLAWFVLGVKDWWACRKWAKVSK